jgi:hypothetical protein
MHIVKITGVRWAELLFGMLPVTVICGPLIPSQLCSCCCPWPSVPNLEYWIAVPFVFSGRLLDQEFSSDRSVHRSESIQLILDPAAHRPISARPEIPVSALGKDWEQS